MRELGLMGNLKDKLADIKHHMDLQQASIANEMLGLYLVSYQGPLKDVEVT